MMKRAFTLIELIVVLAIIAILTAILLPVFSRTRCGPNAASSCRTNLRLIALAWKQYGDDYDGLAPTLATNGAFYGWSDALTVYGAQTMSFQCPSGRILLGLDPTAPDFCGYWMNARIAGVARGSVQFPAHIIAFGEGESGDARYALSHLPQTWRNAENSPAQRHGEGANYAFLDGHVKWLKPEQIGRDKPAAKAPTFLIR